jgi:cupin 2 domain-containing protein
MEKTPANLFANLPADIPEEIFETLLEKGGLKIERIVSKGQASPENFWYDQEQNEWVLVLQGEAEIEFKNEKTKLRAGDHLLIEARKKHRVSYTSSEPPVIWLALHWE